MRITIFQWVACAVVLVPLCGCGGGSGSGGPQNSPVPNVTNVAADSRVSGRNGVNAPVAVGQRAATPAPTKTPSVPAPVSPPPVVFDLRGRVLVSGTAQVGAVVRVTGVSGAVTAADSTVSGAGGFYSFFLGGGTYIVTASVGTHTVTRRITIPAGGQTVDNFDLNL